MESIKPELDALVTSIGKSKEAEGSPFSWTPYLNSTFIRPFGLVVASFLIGHFTGMSSLQTYAVSAVFMLYVLRGDGTGYLLLVPLNKH